MEVIKCPHKNAKHYAKVSIIWQSNLYRECVITVITNMVETAMQLIVLIPIGWFMQKGSVRTAILMTIISKREEWRRTIVVQTLKNQALKDKNWSHNDHYFWLIIMGYPYLTLNMSLILFYILFISLL